MKILLTTDFYTPAVNGVVTSVLNLKRGLEEKGHSVKVLTLSSDAKNYIDDDIVFVGSVNASKIYPGARLRCVRAGECVKKMVEWKPDIVHSQCEFSTFPLARRIADKVGAPLVHTYHTVYEDYTHYFSPSEKMGKKAVSAFSNWIGDRVSSVIAPTAKVEKMLEGYNLSAPIEVVPTGIDIERFYKDVPGAAVESLREALKIPKNHCVVISVCRLAHEKNLEEVLLAFKKINNFNATLVLIGDGPARQELEFKTKTLGIEDSVRFTGMIPQEEIVKYYQMGDLFVSASTSETQGLTYIEALASGTPILCKADECLSGILYEGENGFSFNSTEDFFDKFTLLMSNLDLLKLMAEKSRQSVRNYSVSVFAQRIEDIYTDLLKKNKQSVFKEEQTLNGGRAMSLISIISLCFCIAISVYAFNNGLLSSIDSLQLFVASTGAMGVMFFILLQISQVVVPLIPGGLGCLAGVILFGPFYGFLYNYVGICLGSLIVFAISKSCGRPLLPKLFPKRMIDRYSRWTMEKHRFAKLFAFAIFMPVAPDDFLCYLAGTTPMKWSHYTAIILLGKPFSIALYSVFLNAAWKQMLLVAVR